MNIPTLPRKALLASTVCAMFLSACSPGIDGAAGRRGAEDAIDGVTQNAVAQARTLNSVEKTGRPSNIRVRDGLYLGRDGFRTGRGDPLPRKFETENGISLHLGKPVNLRDFALELRRVTGLRIDYRDLAMSPVLRPVTEMESPTAAATQRADSTSNGVTRTTNSSATDENATDHPIDIDFMVDYVGPLSGLLDRVSSQVGADWEYRGGRIKFLGAQTVTYTIWALGSSAKTSSSVGGGGSSSVFGAASPATTERSINADYWKDLRAGLEAIIPTNGARYSVNQSNGTIVLTAYQNVQERVADYVARENARLSRQVAVKVDVLAFAAEDNDTRSANLGLVMANAATGFGLNMASAANQISDGVNIGTQILENSNNVTEDFSGSSAVLRALSSRGKVSMLKSVSVMAMNNAPTPISIMSEKAYLAGTSSTTDGQTGETSTEVETGVVNNGMNMVVTPRILSSGEVNLDYTMNLSTLTNLEKFETDSMSVQLPEVETRNIMQSVNMESGSTMVIAAYNEQRNARNQSGPFDPRLWGLGGKDGFSKENTQIVILMTPVVIEKQNIPGRR